MVGIDKRTLIDSVTIQKVGSKDDWGKKTFLPPVLLSPVRFDRDFDAPGTINNPAGKKNPSYQKPGVIFVYPLPSKCLCYPDKQSDKPWPT